MHSHITTYTFGDIVYLKTDTDQLPRMVVGITLRPTGILYELSQGATGSDHYEIEISDTPDMIFKMAIETSHLEK